MTYSRSLFSHLKHIILVTFLLSGCDIYENYKANKNNQDSPEENKNYQLIDSNDRAIRLNQETGEIVIISHDSISIFDNDKIQQLSEKNEYIGEVKTDNKKTFPESDNKFWAELKYKWRDNYILYRYSFGPYDENVDDKLKQGFNHISLMFEDKDGFNIAQDVINLDSLTRLVGFSGKPESWYYEGKIKCTKENFLLINSWSTPWGFSSELENAIAKKVEKIDAENKENRSKLISLIESGEVSGEVNDGKISVYMRGSLKDITADQDTINIIVKYPSLFKITPDNSNNINEDSPADIGIDEAINEE